MDTRREHGQYWPGKRTDVGPTPTPADNGKVDRVDLGTLPADATASEMRTAIRNIQNAMRPLATALAAALCGFAMAQTAAWDSLRGGVHVVTNEQDAAAMAAIASATNDIAVKMSGLRSDNAAAIAASTNGIPEAIADHGTRIGALEEAAADRPDMSLYALKSEVPPAVDLAPYATTTDMVNRVEAAAEQTGLQLESLRTEMDGIPETIESLSSRLSLSSQASSNCTAAAAANLSNRIEAISLAFADSNTTHRLMSPDGGTYQDATGTVWRLRHLMAPGLFRLDTVQYYTNGVMVAETNELPGVEWTLWEGYDNGAWEMLAGESGKEEDVGECYREWRDFTNHVAAADMEDMTKFYYLGQLVVAGEEYELQYDGGISESQITLEWPMTEPYKTRFLNFSRTNVTASVWTPADKVLYASSGGGTSSITTNDVCNIVTNEVPTGFTEWRAEPGDPSYTYDYISVVPDGGGWQVYVYEYALVKDVFEFPEAGPFATVLETPYFLVSREIIGGYRNALDLARLVDLPPLTNDVLSMISWAAQAATNYTDAAISTNNPAFVAAVTNCPVVIAAADGTTLGEFGDYGTLGALLAALAAAITWLKTNKADATALSYALVNVVPSNGTAQLTDRAINAVSLSVAATLVMPAAIAGHARDLVVRLVVGADGLNITWGTADAGGVAVDYETEDGEFSDLSAAGTYLVRLTETAAFAAGTGGAADVPAKFLIQCQELQTAAATQGGDV